MRLACPHRGAGASEEGVKWFRNHIPLASGKNNKLSGQEEQGGELGARQPAGCTVSDSGELLILRAEPGHAGKYSCLLGGLQSELLLDVLDWRPQSVAASVSAEMAAASGSVAPAAAVEATTEEEAKEAAAGPSSRPKRSRLPGDKWAGNGQIKPESWANERGPNKTPAVRLGARELAPEPPRIIGPGGPRAAGPQVGAAKLISSPAGPSQEAGGPKKHETAEIELRPVGGGGGADVQFSSLSDRTSGAAGDTLAPEAAEGPRQEDWPAARAGSNSISHGAGREQEAQVDAFERRRSGGLERRPPLVQLVESEIVAPNELGSIPGLLYARQQFHCALADEQREQVAALRLQVDSFARRLCRSLAAQASAECPRLARRLLVGLLSLEREGQPAAPSSSGRHAALELVWWKDSQELLFGGSANESSSSKNNHTEPPKQRVNLKLIDSLDDQLAAAGGATLAERANWQHDNESGPFSARFPAARQPHCGPAAPGRVLQVEGLRRDDSGRYSCGLRLNAEKLLQIFIRLRASLAPGPLLCPKAGLGTTNCLYENDKSPGAARERLEIGGARAEEAGATLEAVGQTEEQQKQQQQQMKTNNDEAEMAWLQLRHLERLLSGRRLGKRPPEPSAGHSLAELSANNGLERALRSSLELIPATRLQTFVLVVSERPGEWPLPLWRTIQSSGGRAESLCFALLRGPIGSRFGGGGGGH